MHIKNTLFRLSPQAFAVIAAFSAMANELILAQCTTSLYGGALLRYSIMIGLFIGSLGIGAAWIAWQNHQQHMSTLWLIEVLLATLGASIPLVVFGVSGYDGPSLLINSAQQAVADHATRFNIAFPIACILSVLVGLLSGMELPILIDLAPEILAKAGKSPPPAGNAEASAEASVIYLVGLDFIGTFAAAAVIPLGLFPWLGLVGSSALAAVLSAMIAVLPLFWATGRHLWRWMVTVIIFIAGLILFTERFTVTEILSHHAFTIG